MDQVAESVVLITSFEDQFIESIISILKDNGQYEYPIVEGPETMIVASSHRSHVFKVALIDQEVVGIIRGTNVNYRPLINLLSVKKRFQRQGIGQQLVNVFCKEVKASGDTSVGVTVTKDSMAFWKKMGFFSTEVFLMVNDTI